MKRTFGNVAAVLVVTLFTALAIFATVQLTGRILGPTATAAARTAAAQIAPAQIAPAQTTPDSAAAAAGEQLVCPATGCAADSCHATQ